jgi:hypothetical protein
MLAQDEGVSATQYGTWDFIGGGVALENDAVAEKIKVKIPGVKWQNNGEDVGSHAIMNVIGGTMANDPVNGRVNVTLPGDTDVGDKLHFPDVFTDFVVEGDMPIATGTLTTTIPSQTVWLGGSRIITAPVTRTYTSNKYTYVDFDAGGTLHFTETPTTDPPPAIVAGRRRLFKVSSFGGTIDIIQDGRKFTTNPSLIQPRGIFKASRSGNVVIPAGIQRVPWNLVDQDDEGRFNPAVGESWYQPNQIGWWLFHWRVTSAVAASFIQYDLYRNATPVSKGDLIYHGGGITASSGGWAFINVTNTSDTYIIFSTQAYAGTMQAGIANSFFMGWYMGPRWNSSFDNVLGWADV